MEGRRGRVIAPQNPCLGGCPELAASQPPIGGPSPLTPTTTLFLAPLTQPQVLLDLLHSLYTFPYTCVNGACVPSVS